MRQLLRVLADVDGLSADLVGQPLGLLDDGRGGGAGGVRHCDLVDRVVAARLKVVLDVLLQHWEEKVAALHVVVSGELHGSQGGDLVN